MKRIRSYDTKTTKRNCYVPTRIFCRQLLPLFKALLMMRCISAIKASNFNYTWREIESAFQDVLPFDLANPGLFPTLPVRNMKLTINKAIANRRCVSLKSDNGSVFIFGRILICFDLKRSWCGAIPAVVLICHVMHKFSYCAPNTPSRLASMRFHLLVCGTRREIVA